MTVEPELPGKHWCNACGERRHDRCDYCWEDATAAGAIDVERLARAILVATGEEGRRPTDDGFEWYGSADVLAEAIAAAYLAASEPPAREDEPR